jgi:hypothetical protein
MSLGFMEGQIPFRVTASRPKCARKIDTGPLRWHRDRYAYPSASTRAGLRPRTRVARESGSETCSSGARGAGMQSFSFRNTQSPTAIWVRSERRIFDPY